MAPAPCDTRPSTSILLLQIASAILLAASACQQQQQAAEEARISTWTRARCLNASGCECANTSDAGVDVHCNDRALARAPLVAVPGVVFLDLSGNRLRAVEARAFGGLRALRRLVLARNLIAAVAVDAFDTGADAATKNGGGRGVESTLEEIDLSDNRLHQVPPCFQAEGLTTIRFPNLTKLLLNHNYLADRLTDTSFGNVPNLVDLQLKSNNLQFLPFGFLKSLSRLKAVDLSDNLLTDLPSITFSAKTPLVTLRIERNRLTSFPTALPAALRDLRLTGNRIARLPPCAAAPCALLPRLRALDLSYNCVSTPEGVGAAFPALRLLDLSGNRLRAVAAGHFAAARALEHLLLQRNARLTRVAPDAFADLPRLRHLLLHGCALDSLQLSWHCRHDDDDDDNATTSITVWLHGNPIMCDCRLRALAACVARNRSRVSLDRDLRTPVGDEMRAALREMTCREPATPPTTVCRAPLNRYRPVVGRELTRVPARELTCVDEPRYVAVAVCLGLALFAVAIVLVGAAILLCVAMADCLGIRLDRGNEKEE